MTNADFVRSMFIKKRFWLGLGGVLVLGLRSWISSFEDSIRRKEFLWVFPLEKNDFGPG